MTAWRVDLFVPGRDRPYPVEIDDKYSVERVKRNLIEKLKLKGDEFELQLIDSLALADGVTMRLAPSQGEAVVFLDEKD